MTEVIKLNHKSLPTVNEIVNSLKRSFIPTIVIEGKDDLFIYRWLKSNIDNSIISLLPCGGRPSLFEVYKRRSEFSDKDVIFIADKDFYRFFGVPEEKKDIIFTTGYCIENDIYSGSTIDDFLDKEDRDEFEKLKEIIGKWFSFEVQKKKQDITEGSANELTVSKHINVICPVGCNKICPDFSKKISYVEPQKCFTELVNQEYTLNVRGKQLFQMLSRFLSKKGRFSNFSEKNLIEIALKQNNNAYLTKIVNKIEKTLIPTETIVENVS